MDSQTVKQPDSQVDKQKSGKLPRRPEKMTDVELEQRGQDAEDAKKSPEYAYLVDLLDRMKTARLCDKVDLLPGQGDLLARLCVEVELLDEIRTGIERDINVGRAAGQRELKRPGHA